MSLSLAALLRGVATTSISGGVDPAKITVAEVRDDSRQVGEGDLFVALPGIGKDGRRSDPEPRFVADAAARGATVLVTEGAAPAAFPGVVVLVPRARPALGLIAANRFGAAAALSLLAVTGTNGKTTMTYLVEGMLRAAGRVPGVIGTVALRSAAPGFASIEATNTTPGALALQSALADMRAAGTTDVVLEATSHALDQDRLAGCLFRAAALTNVTLDHLDYHGTMERYFDAKAILFERLLHPTDGVGVTFVDEEPGRRMRARCAARWGAARTLGVSREPGVADADVVVVKSALGERGLAAAFETPVGKIDVVSSLVGTFNLANVALAVGVGVAAGLPPAAIAAGLASVTGVPGRLERVANERDVICVVDYAHTPDALERALAAMRPLVRGRLLLVFGCGGDRDRSKRPVMGAIAARGADVAIVTSDNPRTEDPESILDMIVAGFDGASYQREVNRRAAIQLAVDLSKPGDVLLIAGKGHEDYQIVGTTKTHFDDREEAAAAFARARRAEA